MPEDPNGLDSITALISDIIGKENLTTTQINDLPEWLKRPVLNQLKASQNLLFPGGRMAQYPFPDQRVANMNPFQRTAYNVAARRAISDSPVLAASEALGMGTLRGDYLYPQSNPFLQQNVLSGMRDIADVYRYSTAPTTQAEAIRAGVFGGSAQNQNRILQQYGLGQTLNNFANQMYGGNYQQERNRQMQQQEGVGRMIQQQFLAPQELAKMGQAIQQQKQNVLDADYKNQYARAQFPYQSMDMYRQSMTPFTGYGSTTTTSPNQSYSGILGPLVGASLLRNNPYGGTIPGNIY